jgi:thiol-disulfide isomerase/thioredoxin
MSKATGGRAHGARQGRAQSAREKVDAQRTRARRAAARRRVLAVGGSVAVVLAIVIGLFAVKLTESPAQAGSVPSDAAIAREIATIPAATYNAVGKGTATGIQQVSGQPLLTKDGKPEVLYMGGEFCPYCAAERWAIAAALSRFGTLSGLQFIHSSPTDAYPNTPTLSFANASYASKYVAFSPVEWYSAKPDASTPTGYAYLHKPTAQQAALFARYANDSFPFVDIGNRYVISGSQFLPSALSGLSWSQVASAMRNPDSAVAKDIDGAANMITAAISRLSHGQPAAVSSSPGVKAAEGSI